MKLGKFFNPTYSKLLYVLCGVLIGISAGFKSLWIDLILFIIAISLLIWGDVIKRKEDKGE